MLVVDNKSNKKYRNLFHLLIVTTLIVISDDSLIFGTNFDQKFTIIKYLSIMLLGAILFLYFLQKSMLLKRKY